MTVEQYFIVFMLAIQGLVWLIMSMHMGGDDKKSGFGPLVGITSICNIVALYFFLVQCGIIVK